jgi:predicted SprT family Zn-dependent metalloprotease
MGTALYRGPFDMTVEFSKPLWPRATEEEQHQTIIHEACHIIVSYKHRHLGGNMSRPQPHGKLWKQAMRRAGVEPKRCHNVDRTGLNRKSVKHFYNCGCMTHEIGAVRHRKIQGGAIYTCRKCKSHLRAAPTITKIGPMRVAAL